MQCCCHHNQKYFDEAKARGLLLRGGFLPAIGTALLPLAASAGKTALSFAIKTAVTSIALNAIKYFTALAQTSGLSKEKRTSL